ncbi:MAG: GNAT family N-acetyltransferase, partial [Candidatus Hydrogenedentota bacterium]
MAQLDGPRALRPEEYSSALGLINSALRPNGPPRILEEYPLVLGKENLENMRVIVKGKEVLSHAAIYFSKLRAGDLFFKVGGVGSVATHPAYRGQGLASAVIRDCIEVMQKTECHLSVLWTHRYDFYRNLGYETAGSEYLFRARATDFAQIQCDCKMVPYHPRYLPEVIRIHEREVFRTERTRREY